MLFPCYGINFERGSYEESIIATGELKNDSTKDYNLAMFKIIIYSKRQSIGSGVIKLYDFKKNATKSFRIIIEAHRDLIPLIVKYEILLESAY